MKLYNIYNNLILEAVTNFKTWITGTNNIEKAITSMLDDDSGGKFYYCEIIYPNKKGVDQKRWVVVTQYGISKKDNPIIRVLEVNNGINDIQQSKTYNVNKIKRILISKVPIYNVPEDFLKLYGDIKNDTVGNNPFKDGQPIMVAKFGTYQYAASTLKNKERAAAKAAELEKQQITQQPEQPVVEPEIQTTQVEPTIQQPEQQITQQPEQPVAEPETSEINPEDEQNPEVETNDNEQNKNSEKSFNDIIKDKLKNKRNNG